MVAATCEKTACFKPPRQVILNVGLRARVGHYLERPPLTPQKSSFEKSQHLSRQAALYFRGAVSARGLDAANLIERGQSSGDAAAEHSDDRLGGLAHARPRRVAASPLDHRPPAPAPAPAPRRA